MTSTCQGFRKLQLLSLKSYVLEKFIETSAQNSPFPINEVGNNLTLLPPSEFGGEYDFFFFTKCINLLLFYLDLHSPRPGRIKSLHFKLFFQMT